MLLAPEHGCWDAYRAPTIQLAYRALVLEQRRVIVDNATPTARPNYDCIMVGRFHRVSAISLQG